MSEPISHLRIVYRDKYSNMLRIEVYLNTDSKNFLPSLYLLVMLSDVNEKMKIKRH